MIHTRNHQKNFARKIIIYTNELIEKAKAITETFDIKPTPTPFINSKFENNPIVTWNVDTEDWKTTKPWKVRTAVLDGLEENAIILLHDGDLLLLKD